MVLDLKKISNDAKLILCVGGGAAIATLPICLAVVAVNSGGFKYSDESRTINLKGKGEKINQDLKEKGGEFEARLEESNRLTQELIEAVNDNRPNRVIKFKARKVEQEIKETEKASEGLKQTQQEAVELVEEAIANP